jgi:hypothetical protein
MARYDFFVAQLQCQQCETISANDASTEMQTYIRDLPWEAGSGWLLGAGDVIGDVNDHLSCDYYEYSIINWPDSVEDIRMLHWWACKNCRSLDNWAEIVIEKYVIKSISATRLTRDVFERSHFIEPRDAQSLAARLAGCSWNDFLESGADPIETLREKLW